MFAKALAAIALLATINEITATDAKGQDSHYARHIHHLDSTRMLKKRTPVPAVLGDQANPCKRENGLSTASFTAHSNLKIVDANGNINVTVIGANNRKPLSVSDASSTTSSNSRQALSVESWTSSSSTSENEQSDTSSSSSSSSSSSDSPSWSSQWQEPSASTTASFEVTAPSATPNVGFGNNGMQVVESWTGDDFRNWDYFTYPDPTHGNVNYVSLEKAQSDNLISTVDGKFKMAVSQGALTGSGRDSVRISSPKNWKKNQLVAASFSHMPVGCGTWPAFWSIGAKKPWPAGGEIDITEGVNSMPGNAYTLHTVSGCTVSESSAASSMFLTSDCQYQPGCTYKDREDASFGPGFNAGGGGVYASYYDDDGIKIWFWPADKVPESLKSGSPDMTTFGVPRADFKSDSCNIDQYFDDEQMLIINTTLMGDWAGATFWANGCHGTLAETLADPGNFGEAFWEIDYVKIFAQ